MNAQTKIRGLYKIGMPLNEITNLLEEAIASTYAYTYKNKQSWLVSNAHFDILKISKKKKWDKLSEVKLKNIVKKQIHNKLNLLKYIENCVNQSSINEEEFNTLDNIINIAVLYDGKNIDQIFCDLFMQQDLDTIDFTDFNLNAFNTSTSFDNTVALKLMKYIIRSYFCDNAVNDLMQNTAYTNLLAPYLKDTNWVNQVISYTNTLLKEISNVNSTTIQLLGKCLSTILSYIPSLQADVIFENILLLRYLINKPLQDIFIKTILEDQASNKCVSIKQYAKQIMQCLNEGLGSIEIFYKYLNTLVSWKSYTNTLLQEIAGLDKQSLDQLHEVVSILATFNSI